jgi:hypothetical protein
VELIYFTPKFSLRRALWASSPIGRRIFFFSSKFWLRRVASGSNEGPYQRCSVHLLWRPVKRFAPQGVICYCILFHSIVSFAIIVFFIFCHAKCQKCPSPLGMDLDRFSRLGKKDEQKAIENQTSPRNVQRSRGGLFQVTFPGGGGISPATGSAAPATTSSRSPIAPGSTPAHAAAMICCLSPWLCSRR